jgi:hypothetical protein
VDGHIDRLKFLFVFSFPGVTMRLLPVMLLAFELVTCLPLEADIKVPLKETVCVTRDCINTAYSLMNSMNTSVDPCENFYEVSILVIRLLRMQSFFPGIESAGTSVCACGCVRACAHDVCVCVYI